jgi:hypothetical protein
MKRSLSALDTGRCAGDRRAVTEAGLQPNVDPHIPIIHVIDWAARRVAGGAGVAVVTLPAPLSNTSQQDATRTAAR